MRQMAFETVGVLPAGKAWYVRTGGGHVWFVNEDPAIAPMALVEGRLVYLVDAAQDQDAPLIQPKALA